ncbi:hypothetical protein [Paenibacillus sp. S02]|uniref:hypothetical protein n=1 Tax=Paenibacillus sp. S02 TaxID=2823904 RepID=UPI001C64515C|nr:hypothetical protein [Paenibacillus sp. S02]QYK68272.1 hypothetical protein KAI36_03423 [Paenibacillus sp. S02]
MTLTQTMIFFSAAMILGSITGILIRCYQEGYLVKTWNYVLILFLILMGSIIVVPFVMPFAFLMEKRKYNLVQRGALFIALIIFSPFTFIFTVSRFTKLSNILVWENAVKINTLFKVVKAKQRSKLRVVSPIPQDLLSTGLLGTSLKTLRIAISVVNEKLTHIMAHGF